MKWLKKTPIKYFSDLFIVVSVLAWIFAIVFFIVFAIFSTVVNMDNSIWSDLAALIEIPLSCGGAMWMYKNAAQHKAAAQRGETCAEDFPDDEEEEFDCAEGTDTDTHSTSDDDTVG